MINFEDIEKLPVPCDAEIKSKLNALLSLLTERQKQALELRFGLVDGKSRTLKQTGIIMGVTGNRIRQIEAKAFRMLRTHYADDVKKFLEFCDCN